MSETQRSSHENFNSLDINILFQNYGSYWEVYTPVEFCQNTQPEPHSTHTESEPRGVQCRQTSTLKSQLLIIMSLHYIS